MTAHKKHLLLLVVGALVVVAGVAGLAFSATRGAADVPPYSMAPQQFSTLQSSATEAATLPSVVSRLVNAWGMTVPQASAVHSLGAGRAVAWVNDGRVCWAAANAAGCTNPSRQAPIGIVIGENAPGEANVEGLADDGVQTVTVTLSDGRTASASPVGTSTTSHFRAMLNPGV